MAAAPDPDEVLRSTDGKANFQRLARLLISGGTSLQREIFDAIHPPSNLPTVLSNLATKKQLKAAKLTKPQWDCLYPSPGVYGKSTDFDVTLLFRLLRTITSLTPPATGWDALPAITDHSLTADLARIKYYRNSVYGHVNQKMEILDDDFLSLWQEISEVLVRIAKQISPRKKKEWLRVIDNYLKSPLTPEDERNVQELEKWYENDVDVKKGMNQLERTVRDEHQDTRKELKTLREKAEDTRTEVNTAIQMFCEEVQHIKDQFARLRLKIDCEDTTGPEGGSQGMVTTQDVMNKIATKFLKSFDSSNPEDRNNYLEYLKEVRKVLVVDAHSGSLIITVKCSTLQILKELWEDYFIGHLNEMAETFLVTEDILKKFGLIAVKLKTTIVEEEYRACIEYFLKRSDDDDYGDLPKHQDSSDKVTIPELLQQLSREVHDAFLRWIPIRARTMEQLEQLAIKLDEHHRKRNIATTTGASMGTLGGFLTVAGLSSIPFTFGSGIVLSGIALSLAGAGIGGAGGVVMTGSKVAEMIQEKSGLEEVQAAIEEDRKACRMLQQQFDFLENFISHLAVLSRNNPLLLRELEGTDFESLCRRIFLEGTVETDTVEQDTVFNKRFLTAANVAKMSHFAAGSVLQVAAVAGSRMGHVAGSAIGAAFLPLNIGLLAKSLSELHSGSTSAIVKEISRILSELKCPDEEESQGLVKNFIEVKFTEAYNRDRLRKITSKRTLTVKRKEKKMDL